MNENKEWLTDALMDGRLTSKDKLVASYLYSLPKEVFFYKKHAPLSIYTDTIYRIISDCSGLHLKTVQKCVGRLRAMKLILFHEEYYSLERNDYAK